MSSRAITTCRGPAPRHRAFRPALARLAAAFFGIVLFGAPHMALGDDTPTFTIEMKDGTVTPARIEIPADTTVKIVIRNTGATAAEFESLRLRKEKVLGPGTESFIVIRRLSPGEYPFYDEFHKETGQGVIVAR